MPPQVLLWKTPCMGRGQRFQPVFGGECCLFVSAVCNQPEKRRRRPVSRVLSPAREPGDDHSSGARVATDLARPTRTTGPGTDLCRTPKRRRTVAPTWSCSRWGLPCRRRCRRRGALLPHPFTLARRRGRSRPRRAVCSLWHFPWGRPRRALPGTVFPWSPDFPPRPKPERPSGRLTPSFT
jgi:hypothetical protein